MEKLKILFIAGVNPYHFANMLLNGMTALEKEGHEVDFLTVNSFKGQKKNMFSMYKETLYDKVLRMYRSSKILVAIKKKIFNKRKLINPASKSVFIKKNGLIIVNQNERNSPCDAGLLLSKIQKQYDLVITAVWENIISAETLRLIYGKLKSPIIIIPADMYPITGGCQYPGNCQGYTHECGCCPILESYDPNDQTHLNFLYKKQIYNSLPCAFLSNSYMIEKAKKTGLLDDVLIKKSIFTLNEYLYYPHDVKMCRKKMHIPENKTFIMFARYISPVIFPRKGILLMVEAINKLCETKGPDELSSMCLILAGEVAEELQDMLLIDIINLGTLDIDNLIKAYSASTVFVSPTVDDAGPSMVNQSIMCGTPVVCFNIGTAIDVIKNGKNGYRADLGNPDDLAHGLEYIYSLNEREYEKMRIQTREIALEMQSLKAFSKRIETTYNELIRKA